MRKIFLDGLPRRGNGINWKDSVGKDVKFIYDDLEGVIHICDYKNDGRKYYLYVDCGDKKNFRISIGDFKYCKIGTLIGKHHLDYIFEIGDVIRNGTTGKLLIKEQTRIKVGKKSKKLLKGYKYRCLICGDTNEKTEDELKRNGCAVCAGVQIRKGYNDLWTVRPDIATLLKDKKRGWEIQQFSNSSEVFICPHCNSEVSQSVDKVSSRGLFCYGCSDGTSYPEKFIMSMLDQLSIDYEMQRKFYWSKRRLYDFYIPSLNMIIETHGEQHYNGNFQHYENGRTLKEEQENDSLKESLAKENGTKYYIVIDCRKSEMEWIKNNVLKSRLSKIFDLTNVSWSDCDKFAMTSRAKSIWNLWNEGLSIEKISNIVRLNKDSVRKYIKRGGKLGICEYDPKQSKRYSKRVVQLNLDGEFLNKFDSIVEAKEASGATNIGSVCRGKNKTSGGYKWMYLENYEKYIKEQEELSA